MDPIHINVTIPDLSLFIGFGLVVFAITLFLAISTHREKLKPLFALLLNPGKYALPLVFLLLLPLALMAVYDIYGLITDTAAWETDKRGLAVLLAAITGAPFVIWRTWIAQKQSATAEQSHMTDRISKAVEQLGAEKTVKEDGVEKTVPNLEVRLGAIYALERIAQDSLRDHIPVMEILCAYVRHNAPAEGAINIEVDYENETWRDDLRSAMFGLQNPPIIVQAILTVIGRRKGTQIIYEQDARKNPIQRNYRLDLRRTNLQNLDLSNAKLANAQLDWSKMQGANLARANLESAGLFMVEMQEADMRFARMKGTKCYGAQMHGANLIEAELQRVNFTYAKLQRANLTKANLQGADCNSSNFQGAILENADLRRADFFHSYLHACQLKNAKMQGADFFQADLTRANFEGADTLLMSVTLTDLRDAENLEQEQLNSMYGDSSTKLPFNLLAPNWASDNFDWEDFNEKWQAAKAAANL